MKALVTRPQEDAAPLASALRARGIEPVLAPMLRILPEPDGAARLGGALAGVQAVLFTSANGARAYAAASSRFDIPAYCVGGASAAAARMAGFRAVVSAEGDVEDLAALTVSRLAPGNGALLHAAGTVTAGDLDAELGAKGFMVRRVELYRAEPARAIAPEAAEALKSHEIEIALFFSPRSARTFVRLAQEAGFPDIFASMTAFGLSAKVAQALRALTWRGIEVAQTPSQGSLLAALDATVGRRSAKGTATL
jgi:uroporphyrinogen-III synthase